MLIIIHNVVSDDFLPVEIETMKHLFVNLFPKRDLGHVAGPAILPGIAQQIPVFGEIADVVVFDSDVVDDGLFFTRNSDV